MLCLMEAIPYNAAAQGVSAPSPRPLGLALVPESRLNIQLVLNLQVPNRDDDLRSVTDFAILVGLEIQKRTRLHHAKLRLFLVCQAFQRSSNRSTSHEAQ